MITKGGLDPEGDEMSPPMHEAAKVGGAMKGKRPSIHSADGPKLEHESVMHEPMPMHGAGEQPLKHLEGYKHKMPK